MTTTQAANSASTNRDDRAGGAVAEAIAACLEDLQHAPLAPRTREAYGQHIASYGLWLADQEGGVRALAEPRARDYAARDFKRWLKLDRGWKPASVNLALAAVDHFNRYLGLGPAAVTREQLPAAAPRALSEAEQRSLLRAAEASSARDRAIVTLLLYTALRLSELAALDIGDIAMSARRGVVTVRSGKGETYREIPLNHPARHTLENWLTERRGRNAAVVGEVALFTGPGGRRLSTRAVDMIVRSTGARAGLALSAHVLRHSCITNLVRGGNDLVLVAELAGHRRLETTRRYSLPSDADRHAAMNRIELDE